MFTRPDRIQRFKRPESKHSGFAMHNQIMDSEDEELAGQKNDYVNTGIQKGVVEKFVFARRKPRERGQRPKFYFYTPDLEDLVICASAKRVKGGTAFKVSTNSQDIKRKNAFYVGLCTDAQSKRQFIGYKVFPDNRTAFIPAVKILVDQVEGNSIFLAPSKARENYQFPEDPEALEKLYGMSVTVSDPAPDPENEFSTIYVRHGDEDSIVITQVAKSEFEVDVQGPVSIFQAFCVTCILTASHKI